MNRPVASILFAVSAAVLLASCASSGKLPSYEVLYSTSTDHAPTLPEWQAALQSSFYPGHIEACGSRPQDYILGGLPLTFAGNDPQNPSGMFDFSGVWADYHGRP